MKQDDILVQRKSIPAENDGTEGYFQLGNSPSLMLSVSISPSASVRLGCHEIFLSVMFLLLDLPQFAMKTSPIMQGGELRTIRALLINTLHVKSISSSFVSL